MENWVTEFAGWLVALDLAVIVALLIFTQLKPWVIFSASTVFLYLSNILSLDDAIKGYTNPSLLVLMLLFLVAVPLEKTTLMRRMSSAVVNGSTRKSILRLSLFSGFFSAFINNTAVVSAMLGPLKRQRSAPVSKLLLPLSYASILGGTLTLIGTSTNLIVNGFVEQAGYDSLGFFDFTMVGLPVFAGCLLVLVLMAPKVLPEQDLEEEKSSQDYFLERRLAPGSSLIGRSVQDNGLRQLERIFLVEVIRDHHIMAPVNPQEVLCEGDILVFTGDLSAIELLDGFQGLMPLQEFDLAVRENLVEVIVSPSAGLVGRTIKEVDFRSRFDAAVVAVRRGDQRLQGGLGNLALQAGDALVLAVGDDFNRRRDISADFILVGGVESNKILSGIREWSVFWGFAIAVVLGATGILPLIKGLLIYLGALLITGIMTADEVKFRFPFQLLVVIGGALGVSQAMFQTGLADHIGGWAGYGLSDLSPLGALIGVYLMTWLFTELVTNNAAAAIMFPLAMAISGQWGDNYMPFVMAVAFGASASFVSPYGYQTNLMVYTAGNYRMSDYFKLGMPIFVVYSVIAVTMINWLFG